MRRTQYLPFLACLLLGFGAAGLAGCAAIERHALSPVPAHKPYPTLGAAFKGAEPMAVRYNGTDSWQEYLYYSDGGARSEMIYTHALGFRTLIRFPQTRLKQLTEGWRFVGAVTRWGAEQRIEVKQVKMQYYPFTLGPDDRACAAFQVGWNYNTTAGYPLPADVAFGYYCAPAGERPDEADLRNLMGSFALTTAQGSSAERLARLDPRSATPAPGVEGTYGRSDFPLLFPVFNPKMRAD